MRLLELDFQLLVGTNKVMVGNTSWPTCMPTMKVSITVSQFIHHVISASRPLNPFYVNMNLSRSHFLLKKLPTVTVNAICGLDKQDYTITQYVMNFLGPQKLYKSQSHTGDYF